MNQTNFFDTAAAPIFQLKGSMLAITILELMYYDVQQFAQQLAEKVTQAPGFFQNAPVILALDKLSQDQHRLDLIELITICRQYGLCPVALRTIRAADIEAAKLLHLPILPPSGARERVVAVDSADPHKVVPPKTVASTKVIKTPVRGGQQIYAQGGDLIVLAPVSAGAELLADGNIHVYSVMRGRALAGIQGDIQARIFCHTLAAEMLSIAGAFKIADELRRQPTWGAAVQVSLWEDKLKVEVL